MKRKILSVITAIFLAIGLVGCGQNKELTEDQTTCEHQWVSVEWDIFAGIHDIYCPRCKLEESVTNKEWNKIEADMNIAAE